MTDSSHSTAPFTAAPAGDRSAVTLRTPADLVAAVPYLLGFHPAESLVVVAFAGRRLRFAARGDLPGPAQSLERALAAPLDLVVRQHADAVALLGYGPPASFDPLLGRFADAAADRCLLVRDVLRVHSGRWWSLLCRDASCCPPTGTPVETAGEVAARLAYAGLVAAPSRREREREVAPVQGPDRAAQDRAAGRAGKRLAALLADGPAARWAEVVRAEGTARVRDALRRYADGGRLDDDAAAWLTLLLGAGPVRDAAWQATTGEPAHQHLWADLTRRAGPELVAPPACLLAVAAWRGGDGVLAQLALDRALGADSEYQLAHLLQAALTRGEPPVPEPCPPDPR